MSGQSYVVETAPSPAWRMSSVDTVRRSIRVNCRTRRHEISYCRSRAPAAHRRPAAAGSALAARRYSAARMSHAPIGKRSISWQKYASRCVRADSRVGSTARAFVLYLVDEVLSTTAQIGTTSHAPRWASINATTSCRGGRVPPRRDTRTPGAESRSRAAARGSLALGP